MADIFNPGFGNHRQADVCEFKARLVYIMSSDSQRYIMRLSQEKKVKIHDILLLFLLIVFFLIF